MQISFVMFILPLYLKDCKACPTANADELKGISFVKAPMNSNKPSSWIPSLFTDVVSNKPSVSH